MILKKYKNILSVQFIYLLIWRQKQFLENKAGI